jgi:hypothetical protein
MAADICDPPAQNQSLNALYKICKILCDSNDALEGLSEEESFQ